MDEGSKLIARAYTRRKFLAFSAAGAAGAALAACGSNATAPTALPAVATTAPTAAGPAASATPVPQALGVTAAASTPSTAAGSAVAGTTTAGTATTGTAASAVSAVATPGNLADKQVFRYYEVEPTDFDPAIATTPGLTWTMTALYDGLINLNPTNGKLEPALATSYQANADSTVWTFKMRSGIKFSDGTPITAKDFEYSWKRVMDPATKSKYSSALYAIKNGLEVVQGKVPPDQLGVKALDDATFEVTLNKPVPFFPLIAATWTCYPVPRAQVEKFGAKWLEPPNLVSTGPFVLKEWKHDQSMVYEPNPNYWGPKPTLSRVELTIYDMPLARALTAYENNELDVAQVSTTDYDRVRTDPKLSKEMKPYPASRTFFVAFDCQNKPTDDVRVRQALALGFDRNALITGVLKNYHAPAPTMLPMDIPGYNPAAALPGDMAKAKQLLADAGFPNGQGFPSDFSIIYSTATAEYKPTAEFLQAEWKKNLGINVQVNPVDAKAFTDARTAWQKDPATGQVKTHYNASLNGWGSDYGDPSNWHNQLFTYDADFYRNHWKNDEFDKLAAQAYGMTDIAARTKMYEQAEVILVQQAPNIPLFHQQLFFVKKPNVQNFFRFPIAAASTFWRYTYITKS